MPKLKLGPTLHNAQAKAWAYVLHYTQAEAWAYGTSLRLEAWNGEAAVHVNH